MNDARQPSARQRGQPLRVSHVGLATRHGLDVVRVDDPGDDPHRLQRRKRALPVHARALHDDNLGPELQRPLRQGAAVTLECAEVALGDLHPAVVMFDNGAGGDLGLVHIQRDDALVHSGQIHCQPPAA